MNVGKAPPPPGDSTLPDLAVRVKVSGTGRAIYQSDIAVNSLAVGFSEFGARFVVPLDAVTEPLDVELVDVDGPTPHEYEAITATRFTAQELASAAEAKANLNRAGERAKKFEIRVRRYEKPPTRTAAVTSNGALVVPPSDPAVAIGEIVSMSAQGTCETKLSPQIAVSGIKPPADALLSFHMPRPQETLWYGALLMAIGSSVRRQVVPVSACSTIALAAPELRVYVNAKDLKALSYQVTVDRRAPTADEWQNIRSPAGCGASP